MKLGEWMAEAAVGDDDFAARVGTDRTTISRIRRGKQRPSWDLASRIFEATAHRVGGDPKDFIEDSAAPDTEPARAAS